MKRAAVLFSALCLLIFLSACGAGISEGSKITPTTDLDGSSYYFYGVARSKGICYACILSEYQEEPNRDDLLYVPLADDLVACFQPEGWVGAWSPEQYLTAKELEKAVKDGKIAIGARFTYTITDGRMDYLEEYNYYKGVDVTTGTPAED